MLLSFGHHQLRGLILIVIGTVPINDYPINAAADHVDDLAVDLRRVGRTVAHIHVVRSAEPHHEVSVNLRIRPRIEQCVHIHFADISRGGVAIALIGKSTDGARVICRLSCQSGCRYDGISRRANPCQRQEQKKSTQVFSTHLPSGAE